MRLPYVVCATLLLAPSVVSAQGVDDWRVRFAAGEEARGAGDWARYRVDMVAAAEAMPAGLLNRPFVQYHAARASALDGRADEAVVWLERAWSEGIESLMISFADHDPAFEQVRRTDAYRRVMGLVAELELTTRHLGGSVHLLEGGGSNVVVQVGPDGVLLVDTGYAAALPALRRALTRLGRGRADLLVVTHAHEDHMGSTAALGIEATVLAHPGTAGAMREPFVFLEGVSLPPKAASALPDVEVARDTTLTFNGARVRIVPTVAHTAGDLTVYFPDARVAHFGDTYLGGNPMLYPGTDDPDGFLDRMDALVDTLHPETIVVGGHDPPTDLHALRAQIETTRACMAYVREALAAGRSADEAAREADGRFAPQWVAFFHRLLAPGPTGSSGSPAW